MPNNYILTSDGSFMSEDEHLQHWGLKKGEEKEGHKYTKREWKNGRWVYYYDNGTGAKTTGNISQEALKRNFEQDAFVDRLNSNDSALYPYSYDKYRAYQKKAKTGLDYLRDNLGLDEYEMYKETRRNKEKSESSLKESEENASTARKQYERTRKYIKRQSSVDDAYTNWQDKERIVKSHKHYTDRYTSAFINSQKEFFNTPIGKIYVKHEKIKKRVNNWLTSLSKKRSKK